MNEEEKNEFNTSEEKMKKKFGKLRKAMTIVEGILMVVPIMVIVILVIVGISVGFNKANFPSKIEYGENKSIILYDENTEEIDWKIMILDILNMKEKVEDDEDYQNGSELEKTIVAVSLIIVAIIGYILTILIADNLAKIFGEVEKQGTPFTENNIKLLKKVNILALILWIAGMMGANSTVGLVFLIVIFAFRSVFEYGYKLQKESDETL